MTSHCLEMAPRLGLILRFYGANWQKVKKKVSSSIFPMRYISAGMGVGGGKLPMAVVPLEGGQIALDLAIWPLSPIVVRFSAENRQKMLVWVIRRAILEYEHD